MPIPSGPLTPFPTIKSDDGGLQTKSYIDAIAAALTTAINSASAAATAAATSAAAASTLITKTWTTVTLPIVTGTVSWDAASGAVGILTLSENAAINAPTNLVADKKYTLIVVQDGTGNRSLTFDGIFVDIPKINTAPNSVTVIQLQYHGSKLYGPQGVKDLQDASAAQAASINTLITTVDDHEVRVTALENESSDKKIMVLCNRKSTNLSTSFNITQSKNALNAKPATGWISTLGLPLRFADVMLNNIEGGSVTHVVTFKNTADDHFTPTHAISRTVVDPVFTYANGWNITNSLPVSVPGVDKIVRAMYTGATASITSTSTAIDGILVADGEYVLATSLTATADRAIWRRSGSTWTKQPQSGGFSNTKVLVTDGEANGGVVYSINGGYNSSGSSTALTFNNPAGGSPSTSKIEWDFTLGRGTGGSTSKAGWVGGSSGFPTFAGPATPNSGSMELECGYSAINLPVGTYTISGNMHKSDQEMAVVVARYVDKATGFVPLMMGAVAGIDTANKTTSAFSYCFSLSEASSIAVFLGTEKTSGTNTFDSDLSTFPVGNKNRRGMVIIEKVSNDFHQVDNDEDNIPVGYDVGYIATFYNDRRVIPSGGTLPDDLTIHIDYIKGPQTVDVVNKSGDYTVSDTGGYGATRLIGYIIVENDGLYNFYHSSVEAGALSMGFKQAPNFATSGHADQWAFMAPSDAEMATNIKPLTQRVTAIGDSGGSEIFFDAAGGRTWFNNNTLSFASATNAVAPGKTGVNRRIKLKAGVYPFFLDAGDNVGGSVNSIRARIGWVHPTRGKEIIPSAYLVHKAAQVTDLTTRILPSSDAQTLPVGYVNGSYTAPTQFPTIPPHGYV